MRKNAIKFHRQFFAIGVSSSFWLVSFVVVESSRFPFTHPFQFTNNHLLEWLLTFTQCQMARPRRESPKKARAKENFPVINFTSIVYLKCHFATRKPRGSSFTPRDSRGKWSVCILLRTLVPSAFTWKSHRKDLDSSAIRQRKKNGNF